MPSSLIRGKHVICKIDDSGEPVVVDDGAVFQRDGVIVEVGRYADLAARYQPDDVIGSAEHVVMPGLVNGHHHIGVTPVQLGSLDQPLELWFATRIAARDVDPYLDTLYSAFEMLESGVTTVHHIHGARRGPVSGWTASAKRILQAYRDVGMRVTYSFGFRDQNRLVYKDDQEFAASLPEPLDAEIGEMLAGAAIPFEQYMSDLFLDLWEGAGKNTEERVRIAVAPANLQWCSDDAFMALKEQAAKYGVGMHMHLLETAYQRVYARERGGSTAVRHLHDIGFLGPEVTFGHGVWLTEDELDLTAAADAKVCHNASSNLRLRSGIAPVNAMLKRGITVGIGIDEAGINDDRDMLQEMRLVLKLHREPGIDRSAPTAANVLQMASEFGARTTGFANEIGTLEVGKGADMNVVAWKQITYPYMDPSIPTVEALVHRVRPDGIDTVLVAGEVVMRNGKSTRLDKAAVLDELAESLRAPLSPAEVRRQELSREIYPHVRAIVDGWLDDEPIEPYYRMSTRR